MNAQPSDLPLPTEHACYRTIVEAAQVLGWRVHHQRGSRVGNPIMGDVGFPDFVLVFPAPIGSTAPGHVLFVEVKSDRKGAHLTREQQAWGDALVRAGARWSVVHVPSELDAFVQTLVDLATVR